MKHIIYSIALVIIACIYVSCDNEDFIVQRLNAPQGFTVSREDTSIFLKWNKVEGVSFYTLVRGLEIIADSLTTESYEDVLGPDTLVEYRIYAVNSNGWRSSTYAADFGRLTIKNYLPRVPAKIEASNDNAQGCSLVWINGRFAASYEIYKNGKLYEKVEKSEFLDYNASTSPEEYTIYSVNTNGKSEKGITVTGKKAYLALETYEKYTVGTTIHPWTFFGPRFGYYTEGSPTISSDKCYEGANSLAIKGGKIQILHDWGGPEYEGDYIISFMAYKASGSFNVYSSFVNKSYQGTSEWVLCTYNTGVKKVGEKYDITIESKADEIPVYIDNLSIKYQYIKQ